MRKYLLTAVVGVALLTGPAPADIEPIVGTGPVIRKIIRRLTTSKAPTTRQVELEPTLANARKLYWRGEYARAAKMYEKFVDTPDGLAASIGLAEARCRMGKCEEALAALRAAAGRGGRNAEWQLARSRALAEVGKYADALAAARKAVELRGDWAPAALRLGQAHEQLGRKDEALAAYKQVEKAIAKRGFMDDAASLVAAGKVMERIAVMTGQRASNQAQNILDNYLQRAYLKVDKTYWPANLATADFMLGKHKFSDAGKEYALAAKLNKRLPEVHVGRGVLHLRKWRFERAIAEADEALKINPRHADALLLKASTYMLWRRFDKVAPLVEKVFQFNPNHLDALSLMAALHVRRGAEDKAGAFVKRVEKVNPNYADLYNTIGQWLGAGRQFDQAERYYKKAARMAPEQAGPLASLGLMYMKTGREELAKETLDKAWAIDNFRADVFNYLRLLDQLKQFQVKQTEHFIIKVHPKYDAVLLEWAADEAERIHPQIVKDFEYEPKEKTILEIFPQHAQFSVRISGKGWLPTVGACTGRVIAMPAPDPQRGRFGRFSWATVLRHEYTHTVTLAATKNRIPHWFTEACAVWAQPDRRNFQAVRLLLSAVRAGRLYPIKDLAWGFVRPKRRGGRSLAYAQSELIFEYIVEKKRYDAIIRMLRGFRDGWTQTKVFEQVLGTTEEQFDKDFAAWAKKQIIMWGYDPAPRPALPKATAAAKKDPGSADAQADLALAQLNRGRVRQAGDTARKALKIDRKHKRALAVLGYALMRQKKRDEAVAVARRLEAVDPRSADAAKVLAECHLAERRWLSAIRALENYKFRRQQDDYGYKKLEKLYMQLGQTEKALPNLIELHRRTLRDPIYARKAAEIYRAAGSTAEALEFFKQVIHINPYDAGVYKAMAGLYLRQKNHELAIRAMRSACLLEPDNADYWTQLAIVYYKIARKTDSPARLSDARAAAEKAAKLDPAGRGPEILHMIEQALKN